MKTLLLSRWLYCALFPALVLWGNNIHAAPVTLADQPLGTQARVPPNIFMTVDDSSSMLRSFNPEGIGNIQRACWTGVNTIGSCTPYDEARQSQVALNVVPDCLPCSTYDCPAWVQCTIAGKDWDAVQNGVVQGDVVKVLSLAKSEAFLHDGHPPLLASAFNGQAYDPLVTYRPPRRADGTFLPDMNAGNTGNWTTVQWQDGQTWSGRPRYNLRALSHQYTQAWRDVLSTRYMVKGDFTAFDSYRRTGTTDINARYDLPPHYYKTSVKWCNAFRADGSADPGANFSNCQDERYDPGDTFPAAKRFIFPYYFAPFGEHTGKTNNTTSPAFELVILDFANGKVNGQGSITHSFYNEEIEAMDSFTRSFAEEAQNFANWAAYYKNRLVATKTVASHAFADIDSTGATTAVPRIGFSSINRLAFEGKRELVFNALRTMAVGTLPIASFQGAQRANFFDRLFGFRYALGGTPLQAAMIEVGEMFRGTGASAPIIYSCQRNYHIMFTDGMWSQSPGSDSNPTIGNLDSGKVPPHLVGMSLYGNTLTPDTPWPDPVRDHKGASLSLADIALYYWMTDLRPSMENDVASTNKDPATWQHLNFSGMGYGVRGTLPSKNQAATLAKMGDGAGSNTFAWPNPTLAENETRIDDLWHASVNGFGRYVAAVSPDEFRAGLRSILNEILNLGGARAASGLTSRNATTSTEDNRVYNYAASFSSGWNGEIIKREVSDTGVVGDKDGASAAEKLQKQLTPTSSMPSPWRDSRNVFTRTVGEQTPGNSGAVPFSYEGLTQAQRDALFVGEDTASPTVRQNMQKNMIAYLRGDRTHEGDTLRKFRVRGTGPLGDIVNAAPVVVNTPGWNHAENTNAGYEAFVAAHKTRKTMVYVAANDGMLHAFDGNLEEQWAYIPMNIIRDPADGGIAALSYQEAGIHRPFKHLYYVDATPRVMDVKIGNEWKTILVGGLGKGGKSYYALDVTDSSVVNDEAVGAKEKSLWEFTDPNMGYTFGRAVLAKTNAWSNEWVAIFPSGYNNANGQACIFLVDLKTGNKKPGGEVCSSEGTADNPLELVSIGSYVEDAHNQLVTAVYGGDQQGNLWRFRMEDSNPANWKAEKMAVLKDGSGNRQYVTTEPWIQLGPVKPDGKADRFVLVGTGGFRNDDDLNANTPKHTFYAFRDGDNKAADTFTGRDRNDPDMYGITSLAGVPDKPLGEELDKNGWYEDMDTGYHLNLNPQSAFYIVVYAANKYIGNAPGNIAGDLCNTATFDGRFFARTVERGKPALGESAVGKGDGKEAFYSVPTGITGFNIVWVNGKSGKPRLTVMYDDTAGKTRVIPEEVGDLGGLPEAPEGGGEFRRLNIRFIDN